MNLNLETWQEIYDRIAEAEYWQSELVEAAVSVQGKTWFESQAETVEDLEAVITAFIEANLVGIYDGSPEELYKLIEGTESPRYLNGEQWIYDLECEGWNFEEVQLGQMAAFRP